VVQSIRLFLYTFTIVFLLLSGFSGAAQSSNEPYLQVPTSMRALTEGLSSVDAVNTFVNSYPYKADKDLYGGDYAATPTEFFKNGGGDCEDYVFAKAAILLQNGLAKREDLIVFLVEDRATNTLHAVLLIIVTPKMYLMLDNRFPVLLPLTPNTSDYGYRAVDVIRF